MEQKPTGHHRYNEAFKRQIIQEVITGKLTETKARKKYTIGGKSTILKWIRKLPAIERAHMIDTVLNKQTYTTQVTTSTVEEPLANKTREELLQEIAKLKYKLKDQEILLCGANATIEIAEQRFNIEIRKKFVTK